MSQDQPQESSLTVGLALAANVAVAIVKIIAGLLTGSAALLAEAAHSVGDCTTELLLVTALHRSARPADRRHPFGYGKERYFWSLLAALGIFTLGAGFSAYQGIDTLISGRGEDGHLLVGILVIVAAMILEGISFTQAVRHVRREASRTELGVRAYLRDPDDPTVKLVLLEDSAALVGLVLALAGLALRAATGHPYWDGAAALAIAALLVVVAFELARTNVGLLIGKAANPVLVGRIRQYLADRDEVLEVVDLLTMMVGTGKILVCVRLDFVPTLSADEIEYACLDIQEGLRSAFVDLDEVFLEPVPRGDAGVRQRVRDRYGEELEAAVDNPG